MNTPVVLVSIAPGFRVYVRVPVPPLAATEMLASSAALQVILVDASLSIIIAGG